MKPKKFVVRARHKHYHMTVLFLEISTTRAAARERCQSNLDKDGLPYRVLKSRTRLATQRDLENFARYDEKSKEF